MKKIKNIISILLILAGIGLFLYPMYEDFKYKQMEAQLLAQYDEAVQTGDFPVVEEDEALADEVLGNLDQIFGNFDEANRYREVRQVEQTTSANEPTKAVYVPKLNVIGRITIDKINLKMPILDKTNETNLNYGATHIDGTSPLGQVGNAGIAGHRGRSFGIMFNRLNEMAEGDIIKIETNGLEYLYKVTSTTIVLPTETSVLNRNKVSKMLTLVTCDPVVNPTHRIIVHAVLIEE